MHFFALDTQHDLMLIDKIIGVGEIALSDHRSSWPSYQEVVALVSDARVTGMLAGKVLTYIMHNHISVASICYPSISANLFEPLFLLVRDI